MPTLRQITCSVELSETPFTEYHTRYRDGAVECYIATPDKDLPFTIHITAEGYAAPGLAVFVFIDGIYQCNRNQASNAKRSILSRSSSAVTADFRMRQKEEKLPDGTFVGREWTFTELVKADKAARKDKQYEQNVGKIEVIILRCQYDATDANIRPPKASPAPAAKVPTTKETKAKDGQAKPASLREASIKAASKKSTSEAASAIDAGDAMDLMFGADGAGDFDLNGLSTRDADDTPSNARDLPQLGPFLQHPPNVIQVPQVLRYGRQSTYMMPRYAMDSQMMPGSWPVASYYPNLIPQTVMPKHPVAPAIGTTEWMKAQVDEIKRKKSRYESMGIDVKDLMKLLRSEPKVYTVNFSDPSLTELQFLKDSIIQYKEKSGDSKELVKKQRHFTSLTLRRRNHKTDRHKKHKSSRDKTKRKTKADDDGWASIEGSESGSSTAREDRVDTVWGQAKSAKKSRKEPQSESDKYSSYHASKSDKSKDSHTSKYGNAWSNDAVQNSGWDQQNGQQDGGGNEQINNWQQGTNNASPWGDNQSDSKKSKASKQSSTTAFGSQGSSSVRSPSLASSMNVKPYWNTWDKGKVHQHTPGIKQEQPHQARPVYVYSALPAPAVSSLSKVEADRGVQIGKGAAYGHKTIQPEYLDEMDAPYAVFTFKYCSHERLEKLLDRKIRHDFEEVIARAEKDRLMAMSKEEMADELMRLRLTGGDAKSQTEVVSDTPAVASVLRVASHKPKKSKKESSKPSAAGQPDEGNAGWGAAAAPGDVKSMKAASLPAKSNAPGFVVAPGGAGGGIVW